MELSYYRMYIELLMGNDSIVDAIVDSMIILSCLAKTLDIFYACLACVLASILSSDSACVLPSDSACVLPPDSAFIFFRGC